MLTSGWAPAPYPLTPHPHSCAALALCPTPSCNSACRQQNQLQFHLLGEGGCCHVPGSPAGLFWAPPDTSWPPCHNYKEPPSGTHPPSLLVTLLPPGQQCHHGPISPWPSPPGSLLCLMETSYYHPNGKSESLAAVRKQLYKINTVTPHRPSSETGLSVRLPEGLVQRQRHRQVTETGCHQAEAVL